MGHILHKFVGDIVKGEFGDAVLLDRACGGSHDIPLYAGEENKRQDKYCDVDILIESEEGIKVIIEIEESKRNPTQVCGKYLTSALASTYIYKGKHLHIADSVLFIQVMDTKGLKPEAVMIEKWRNLEKSIHAALPLSGGSIDKYVLVAGAYGDFKMTRKKQNELLEPIRKALC